MYVYISVLYWYAWKRHSIKYRRTRNKPAQGQDKGYTMIHFMSI